MMRSLITDPMSWWPVGIVIGAALGAAINRYKKHRATVHPADSIIVAAAGHDDRRASHRDPDLDSG